MLLEREVARELAGDGIGVNAIAPSRIDADVFGPAGEARREQLRQGIPTGGSARRVMSPGFACSSPRT